MEATRVRFPVIQLYFFAPVAQLEEHKVSTLGAGGSNPLGRSRGFMRNTICNPPGCDVMVEKTSSFLCGGGANSTDGCGLFFCHKHLYVASMASGIVCDSCAKGRNTFEIKEKTG